MDIYQRFKALPRGRKGNTTVVIVEETVLAELIAAAQAPEAKLFGALHATVGPLRPGATGRTCPCGSGRRVGPFALTCATCQRREDRPTRGNSDYLEHPRLPGR